ncbi:hypothetical protein V1264_010798 [Littorina saxatilis]|uniref:VWFC domain-containing protein n=1 Tax=Littorina saxatilis TaxID=31220 RepID=A0AAN9BSR7_9CAEN
MENDVTGRRQHNMVVHTPKVSTRWTHGVLVFFFFFAFCLLTTQVTGDCLHDGQRYSNQSIWQLTRCKVCTCDDPVPVCQNMHCRDPRCDYSSGQQLQVVDDECCPVCVDMGRPCLFQGQPVPDKTSWTPSHCVTCACDDGEVRCSRMTCPPVTCKPGQVSQSLPGQCCPRCLPSGRPCRDEEGSRREDGSEWSPLPCVLCVCRDGHSKCLPRQCPRPNCPQEDVVAPGPGECCSRCKSQQCNHHGQVYQDGEVWKTDTCTTCLCHSGAVHCKTHLCQRAPPCQQDEMAVSKPDQCCPQCLQKEGACEMESIRRFHRDIWNISDCEYCMCHHGDVQCRTLVCPSVQCAQEEVLVQPIGKCCPECITPSVCRHEDQTFQEGSTWDADACTVCTCIEGQVRCYHKACPLCPDGQSRVTRQGQCCGHCEPVQCSPACRSCVPGDSNHCTQCRDAGRLLQTGRCVDQCQDGYYPVANNTCLACHSTCKACIDGTKYHCTSCPPASLIKDGQCVSHCGSGYFLRNGQCLGKASVIFLYHDFIIPLLANSSRFRLVGS